MTVLMMILMIPMILTVMRKMLVVEIQGLKMVPQG
jgi:hypothetical protein